MGGVLQYGTSTGFKAFIVVVLKNMGFEEKYPRLWQFFAGYYHDAHFDNLTDEAVVAGYKADLRKEDLPRVVVELDKLIADVSYWEQAASSANLYFATQEENLSWLLLVRRELMG